MTPVSRINDGTVWRVILLTSLVFTIAVVVLIALSVSGGRPPLVGWDYQAPTAVFGVVSMIALINVIFPASRFPLQRKTAPLTFALSLMGTISYALRAAGIAGPRFVELSGFQIIPVRYIEWSCTTPLLVMLCAVMVNAPTGATMRVILADFFCIVLGGVALCLPLAPRIVVVIVCCACGALWAVGFGRILLEAHARGADGETKARVTFIGISSLLLFIGYQIVFFLGLDKHIAILVQEYAYATLDVTAKVLLTVVLTNGSFNSAEAFVEKQMQQAGNELIFLNTVVRTIRRPTQALQAAAADADELIKRLVRKTESQTSSPSHGSDAQRETAGGLSPKPAVGGEAPPSSAPTDDDATKHSSHENPAAAAPEKKRGGGDDGDVDDEKASNPAAAAAATKGAAGSSPGDVQRRSATGAATAMSVTSAGPDHRDPDAVVASLFYSISLIRKTIMDAVLFIALQAGVVKARPTKVLVERLLSDVQRSIQPVLLRRGVGLSVKYGTRAPPSIEFDPVHIEYVIQMCITSAVLSAPRGSKVEILVDSVEKDAAASGLASATFMVADIGQQMDVARFGELTSTSNPGSLAKRSGSLLSRGREGSEAEYVVADSLLSMQGGALRLRNLDAGVALHIIEAPLPSHIRQVQPSSAQAMVDPGSRDLVDGMGSSRSNKTRGVMDGLEFGPPTPAMLQGGGDETGFVALPVQDGSGH